MQTAPLDALSSARASAFSLKLFSTKTKIDFVLKIEIKITAKIKTTNAVLTIDFLSVMLLSSVI